MQYASTTTHPTVFHNSILCTQLTNTKHNICVSGGEMAQDVGMVRVKVLWCHSRLVWLVFEASIPTCTCFPSENFLCDLLHILIEHEAVLVVCCLRMPLQQLLAQVQSTNWSTVAETQPILKLVSLLLISLAWLAMQWSINKLICHQWYTGKG